MVRRGLSLAEFGFAARLIVAGMGAYGVAFALGFHSPYSAVFSALIVTRPYSEGAWTAAGLRLVATAAGIAVSFAALWLKGFGLSDAALLFLALAPLSLLAAWDQSYRTALITVLIMLSAPTVAHAPELDVALARGVAVALGAVIGVFVSALVLPQSHERVVAAQARRVTDILLQQGRQSLNNDLDAWRIERVDREVRKTLLEIGRASRDFGRRAAKDNPSARIIGLTRYIQAALILLRAEWRKLGLEDRPTRAAWITAVAAYFAARWDAAGDGGELARLTAEAKAFDPAPVESVLTSALLRSLATLKPLVETRSSGRTMAD